MLVQPPLSPLDLSQLLLTPETLKRRRSGSKPLHGNCQMADATSRVATVRDMPSTEGEIGGDVVPRRPSVRCEGNVFPLRRSVGFLAVLLIYFAWSVAAASEAKRVVLLHSFGRDFKPWSENARVIRSELERRSSSRLDISDLSLMTARFSDENPEIPFVDYLRALFARHHCSCSWR